jgi:hypothetical protein
MQMPEQDHERPGLSVGTTNDMSAESAELPRSAYLDHTLRRARTAAEQRSHRYVTLEHFLSALLDDPDAARLLRDAGADYAGIQAGISDTVNNRMASLMVPDGRAPTFSYKFDSLMLAASADAANLGRTQIDGGLALIGIAKDADSAASAILNQNGFNAGTALRILGAAGVQATAPQAAAPLPPEPSSRIPPRPELRNAPALPHDGSMDDMLASVRSILEAEERKERSAQLPFQPQPPTREPSLDPRYRNGPVRGDLPPNAVSDRVEPALGQAGMPKPRPQAVSARADARLGVEEPPVSSFDFIEPPSRPVPENNRRRRRSEPPGAVKKALETIPRKVTLGVAEEIAISFSKDEASALFGRSGRNTLQQERHVICRAVTVRVTAPEGGFFVEPTTPETQWIFDRPGGAGKEPFGRWSWTVIPNEKGLWVLSIAVSARDIDGNGLAGDTALPEQSIRVRVRGSLWRGLIGVVKTAFVLLAGSGLTVGGYFALKMLGKLPPPG